MDQMLAGWRRAALEAEVPLAARCITIIMDLDLEVERQRHIHDSLITRSRRTTSPQPDHSAIMGFDYSRPATAI
jgi:hypothetical protein